MPEVALAVNTDEIAACYPVMAQLRPHLTEEIFVERATQQMQEGYRLAYLQDSGIVHTVAGFRIISNLAWGRFLYVDDLVTDSGQRSKGYGKQMLDWLVRHAKGHGCKELHLDSGLQRLNAHRFYEQHNVIKTGFHFAVKL